MSCARMSCARLRRVEATFPTPLDSWRVIVIGAQQRSSLWEGIYNLRLFLKMCAKLRSFAASQLRRHIFSKDKKELFIINDVGLSVPSQNRGPEEETILNFEYTG